VQGLWDELTPHAEEWRTIGVFPAAVPIPEDAPLLHRLLGLTGGHPTRREGRLLSPREARVRRAAPLQDLSLRVARKGSERNQMWSAP